MKKKQILYDDLDLTDKKAIMDDPHVQALCLHFMGRVKRVKLGRGGNTNLDAEDEAIKAVGLAEDLMTHLPFNAIKVSEEGGDERITTSPSEIAYVLAYYLKKLKVIP